MVSDRFSVATFGSDQIISSSPTFPLVDSDLPENLFRSAAFRTSLPLVIASPCADVSFSSLADSSSTAMALDTSVIKESRTPDAACPSLLDVSALDSPVSPALSHEVSSDWGRPFLRLSNGAGQLSIFLWSAYFGNYMQRLWLLSLCFSSISLLAFKHGLESDIFSAFGLGFVV